MAHCVDRDWISPVLIGCVSYCLVSGGIGHQTGFIRKVMRSAPTNDPAAIAPSLGDIAAEQLRLKEEAVDGRFD